MQAGPLVPEVRRQAQALLGQVADAHALQQQLSLRLEVAVGGVTFEVSQALIGHGRIMVVEGPGFNMVNMPRGAVLTDTAVRDLLGQATRARLRVLGR